MKCWISAVEPHAGGHGELNLREALKHSCNCYFYQLGNEVGIAGLEKTARDLGLGQLSGLGLPGESPGIVPSPAWMKTFDPGARWTPAYTANVAIGQGATLATPLQMATLAAAIANGGRVLAPNLVAGATPEVRHELTHSGCKPEDLEMLRASMADSVNAGRGSQAKSSLISIAGRTGSGQSFRKEGEKRVAEVAAWFIGYAPADAPRYAFAILVEGGRSGAATAAPLARRIMESVAAGLPAPEPQPESKGHFEVFPPSDN
jgi:penicillin-binding protein 2